MLFQSLDEVRDEFESLGELYDDPFNERMRLIIRLGESLEPMPAELKTEVTRVPGCASDVWVYALPTSASDRLHFLADGTSAFTKGIVALILLAVQDRSAEDILQIDIEALLEPFHIGKQLTSIRTSGLLNMIKKIRQTAERLAA
jgi:cysteine desulfuration protein SufE